MGVTDDYISTGEAARILGIPPVAASNMCASGRVPAEKIANIWLICKAALEEMAKTYQPKVGRPRTKRKYTRRRQA